MTTTYAPRASTPHTSSIPARVSRQATWRVRRWFLPTAVEAGGLATAFSVLSPTESEALGRSRPDVEFALVLANGRHIAVINDA